MGFALTSGTFTEDFNYGNPYGQPLPVLPPEFTFSNSEVTHSGIIIPDGYARTQFSIQHQSRLTNSQNTDTGLHGGATSANGYYLVFPFLSWNQVQTITLSLYLSAKGVLTYDRSYDGYIGDIHSLVVNGVVNSTVSNTSGHTWTTTTLNLKKGTNNITWSIETPPRIGPLRGGVSTTTTQLPNVARYFRLTNINVTNVASVIYPVVSYVNLTGVGSSTTTSALDVVASASLSGTGSLVYKTNNSGSIPLIGFASFITDKRTDLQVKPVLRGVATMTASAIINNVHSSVDAGLVIDAKGELTVDIPIDTTQTIQALIRPINTTVVTMTTPVILNGKPIVPKYRSTQATVWSTANTYTYNDAIDPSSVDHVLPHTPTYRWVSVDCTGGLDASLYAWPERFGGPSLESADPFAPTIHPHWHFNEKDFSYTEYVQVVTFYWRYVQHMWVDLGTQTTPFSFTIVGMFNPTSNKQWNHVLSTGYSVTDPTKWIDDVQDGVSTALTSSQEGTFTGNEFFGIDDGIVLRNPSGNKVYSKGQVDWRPTIYTIVYTGTDTYVYSRHRNHKWKIHSSVNNTTAGKFLIGREPFVIGDDWASHMSLMEICFFSRSLTDTQVLENEDYLMGVYQLEKYV